MAYGFGPGGGPGRQPPLEEFMKFLAGPGGHFLHEANVRSRHETHDCVATPQEGKCLKGVPIAAKQMLVVLFSAKGGLVKVKYSVVRISDKFNCFVHFFFLHY